MRAGNAIIFILAAFVFSWSYVSNAQDKRPVKANQKTIIEPQKKVEHKKHAGTKHKKPQEISARKRNEKRKKQ